MEDAVLRSDSSGSLRAASCNGSMILLDIKGDRLFKLNAVAMEIWTLMTEGHEQDQIASLIAKKYSVDKARVVGDIQGFAERLNALRMEPRELSSIDFAPSVRADKSQSYPWYGGSNNHWEPSPPLLVLGAILGLLAFDLMLAVLSFKTLCAAVKAWPTRRRCIHDRIVAQVCSAVQEACVWYPKRAVCLQRSAVATCMLRLRGVPAHMVIGVKPMPFLAHAWVEADGSVVNDWPKVRTFYTPVLSL